jgi:hypothetical protein
LSKLSCQELAELSRASYFVGHWKPSHTKPLFDNSKGQAWKVSNCCDQVLRKKLGPYPNIEIHKGILRVTFSSKECWMWEEFGLATEKNLEIYKACNLSFNEVNLQGSADKLKVLCGDLWGDIDLEQDNEIYLNYQQECKEAYVIYLQEQHAREIERAHNKYRDALLKADKDKTDAAKELEFNLLCLDKNISLDNLIYYSHRDMFTFGWRSPIEHQEAEKIRAALSDSKFNYEIKT